MKIIGIIGGIASGKSLVADCFRDLGAAVLDGDRAGHEVLQLPTVREAAIGRWGQQIADDQGQIDRAELAKIVFGTGEEAPAELAFLEQLTHEKIGEKLKQQAAELAASGDHLAAVLDAPVLLKAGWDRFCDQIVFVDASQPVRLERAISRGWSAEELALREQAQTSLEAKRERSDANIDNSGSLDATRRQVRSIWDSLADSPPVG